MTLAKSILVVEDERVVARDIQRSLCDLGYDVPATAATAEQAIQYASERCPDLVLMDIRIKGDRDGIDTAAILRKRFDVPVVFLTAYADAPTIERAKTTEPLGYLLKPVKANELRSAVEIALYKHAMDRRLRDRERWLAVTLRSIGDAVISTDSEGRVNYMNPVAEALTGAHLKDAIGRSSRDVIQLVDTQTRNPIADPMQQALRAATTIHVDGALRAAGSERVIADSSSPIIDDHGQVLGAVMVFRDVSEQKRIQRQLELADRLASIGTMAAGVAHEINNPLAAVVANLALALEEIRRRVKDGPRDLTASSVDLEAVLRDAQVGAERIRRIVADLKTFATSDSGAAGTVDVREVLEWSLEMTTHELRPRARIVRELGATPKVVAEAGRLGHVFLNILLNAAHALPEERADANEVRIATRTDDAGRAVIEVRDTGAGMSPELLKRAFDPFFTTKDVGAGSGLGLAICHGIVRSLGGEIELLSELGVGTTVRIVLPAARVEPAALPRASTAVAAKGVRGRVLVVDDEEMMRSVLRRILGTEHGVTCPANSTEALALIDAGNRFDLILCDLMMPELSGMELHEQLLARHPDQARRMVFITGGAFTPRTEEFIRSVANRHVQKPCEPAALRQLVRDLLAEYGTVQWEGAS